jgi:hypothetical protein
MSTKLSIKNKFIYEFDVKEKYTKTQKIEFSVKLFTNFLKYYHKINREINPSLTLLTLKSYKKIESSDKKHFFIHVITVQENSHPFSIFGTYNDTIIYIMVPIGGKIGQYNLSKLNIKILSNIQKFALFNLLKLTIKLREANINKYTIKHIHCANIKPCIQEKKKYLKNGIKLNNTDITKLNNKYYKIISVLIKTFMGLLKTDEFTKATDFLLKDTKKNICLKNYFLNSTNSKELIGHLKIFIEIYKTIYLLRKSI